MKVRLSLALNIDKYDLDMIRHNGSRGSRVFQITAMHIILCMSSFNIHIAVH